MEVENIERFDDVNAVTVTEFFVGSLTDNRIHVDRVDCLDVGMFVDDAADRTEHVVHRLTEIFAAMGGNHNQTAVGCPFQLRMVIALADGGFQRINGGIARDVDRGRVFSFL